MSTLIEFGQAAFHVVNLPATLLLLMVVLYWITVIAGAMDVTTFDVDLPDVDGDFEMGAEAAHPTLDAFFEYFNLKHVPISIFLTFFALPFWACSMMFNELVHSRTVPLLGLAVFAVNLPVSLHAAKAITWPMVPIFKQMKKDVSSNRDLIGSRVVVTSSTADAAFGLAEIVEEGAPITLNVRTEGETLPKGTEAVILQHIPEKDVYLITPLEY
jgi:hypothetical protein